MKFLLVVTLILWMFPRKYSSTDIRVRYVDANISSHSIQASSCDGVIIPEFQQLIEANGTLYVGATNTILQLSPNLSLLKQFQSGPGNDSEICLGPIVCQHSTETCREMARCQNNYNTLLLPYRDRLLACGTLYESCDLLMLSNVASVYGSARDLKCRDNTIQQYVGLSSRNRSYPVVAAIYVNQTHADSDLFFLGRSLRPFVTLLAPSSRNSYFSLIDDTDVYLSNQNVANRKPVAHLAWTTDEYAYILWSNATNPVITLSRYCIDVFSEQTRSVTGEASANIQKGARSYTEIPLRCNVNGLSATNLISAKVVFNKLYLLFQSNNTVAMCTSSVLNLNDEFNFIRRRCWNSTDGNNYARTLRERSGGREGCSILNIYEDYWSTCAFSQLVNSFISPIAGIVPVTLTNEMTLNLPNEEVSSGFTIGMENELVTALIGTSSGNILKIRLAIFPTSIVSEIISTGQNFPILTSITIDESGQNLFAISKNSIVKVNVANCTQYRSCTECIESMDIYCGWCIYQGRCTRKNSCDQSERANMWVSPSTSSDLCPRIANIQPNSISVDRPSARIDFVLAGTSLLPDLDYICRFSIIEHDIQTPASSMLTLSVGNLTTGSCQLILTSANIVPADSDHRNVTIDVVYENNTVASEVIRVFSCSQIKVLNTFTMCSSCASSEWGCSWCPASATCGIKPDCDDDVITSNATCPVLSEIANVEIPKHVGKITTFPLQTARLPQPFSNYQCQYVFCGKNTSTQAVYINATSVECTLPAKSLTCNENRSSIYVYLVYNRDYIIDVPVFQSITSQLFNCTAITRSCGNCVAFRSRYNVCGWCGDRCVTQFNCSDGFASNIRECEAGVILSAKPLNGPFEGGTVVEIKGKNLGSSVSEIARVTLGSVDCTVIEEEYILSQQINCRTGSAFNNEEGIIAVHTTYSDVIQSDIIFQFKAVEVISFSPSKVLNRSSIMIYGRNLNVSTKAVVYLGMNRTVSGKCSNRSNTSMTCQLPPVAAPETTQPSIVIDNYVKTFKSPLSIYEDPFVSSLDFVSSIAVFIAAGRNISIVLSSVAALQRVELETGGRFKKMCVIDNTTLSVLCHIPPLAEVLPKGRPRRNRRQVDGMGNSSSTSALFDLVLILDNKNRIDVGRATYRTNPVIDTRERILPCSINNPTETEAIDIPGRNFKLDEQLANSEYNVSLIPENSVEHIPCNVSLIEQNVLRCSLLVSTWNKYRERKITIRIKIGELEINEEKQCETRSSVVVVIVAIVVPLAFLLISVFCFWLCWRENRRF